MRSSWQIPWVDILRFDPGAIWIQMLECNGITGFDCTPNELSLGIVAVGFGNTNGSGTRFLIANSWTLVLRNTKKGIISHGSKASHKPSLLLFSCNTAIITECVVGWFFGAKHFGHFVRSFLFLIDDAIPRMPANNKNNGLRRSSQPKAVFLFYAFHL